MSSARRKRRSQTPSHTLSSWLSFRWTTTPATSGPILICATALLLHTWRRGKQSKIILPRIISPRVNGRRPRAALLPYRPSTRPQWGLLPRGCRAEDRSEQIVFLDEFADVGILLHEIERKQETGEADGNDDGKLRRVDRYRGAIARCRSGSRCSGLR